MEILMTNWEEYFSVWRNEFTSSKVWQSCNGVDWRGVGWDQVNWDPICRVHPNYELCKVSHYLLTSFTCESSWANNVWAYWAVIPAPPLYIIGWWMWVLMWVMVTVTWSCPNKRHISAGVNPTSKDSCLLCLPGSVNYCVMSHYESEWGQVTWYYNQTKYSILHPTLRHWSRLSCVQFISLSLVTGHHDDDQYSLRVHYFCSCSDYVNNKLVSTTNW